MKRLPAASNASEWGPANWARVAGPPSPRALGVGLGEGATTTGDGRYNFSNSHPPSALFDCRKISDIKVTLGIEPDFPPDSQSSPNWLAHHPPREWRCCSPPLWRWYESTANRAGNRGSHHSSRRVIIKIGNIKGCPGRHRQAQKGKRRWLGQRVPRRPRTRL